MVTDCYLLSVYAKLTKDVNYSDSDLLPFIQNFLKALKHHATVMQQQFASYVCTISMPL